MKHSQINIRTVYLTVCRLFLYSFKFDHVTYVMIMSSVKIHCFLTWKEHIRVSSTLIIPPALSNSPQ